MACSYRTYEGLKLAQVAEACPGVYAGSYRTYEGLKRVLQPERPHDEARFVPYL